MHVKFQISKITEIVSMFTICATKVLKIGGDFRLKYSNMFCSLAVLDPRVGHTVDVLSPFIPVLCHFD